MRLGVKVEKMFGAGERAVHLWRNFRSANVFLVEMHFSAVCFSIELLLLNELLLDKKLLKLQQRFFERTQRFLFI